MPAADLARQGLVWVSDTEPGITRRRAGRGFSYRAPDGTRIACATERARIDALGVPPAYTDVWICSRADGHLQATGLDARRRKQYRYHADWSRWRDEVKFAALADFGFALPRLRAAVRRDLDRPGGERELSLAAVVSLLDLAHLRIGTESYSRENRTYGATTLLRRHLRLDGDRVRLTFRAKGGRRVQATLRDARLHRALQETGDLPGRRLFTWLTPAGEPRAVESHDVNCYIADRSGLSDVSAKTFRTWAGTRTAFEVAEGATGRLSLRDMTHAAAEALHNTPAIARKSYIHPAVLDLAALDPAERADRLARLRPAGPQALRAPERRLLALLCA